MAVQIPWALPGYTAERDVSAGTQRAFAGVDEVDGIDACGDDVPEIGDRTWVAAR
jgi:hypothetical protein